MVDESYIFTKAAKWHLLVPFSPPICHTKQLNLWPNSLANRVVNHSWLSACQGKMGPFQGHLALVNVNRLEKRPE